MRFHEALRKVYAAQSYRYNIYVHMKYMYEATPHVRSTAEMGTFLSNICKSSSGSSSNIEYGDTFTTEGRRMYYPYNT